MGDPLTQNQPITDLGGAKLAGTPQPQGEVERLLERATAAVSNLEQEVRSLVNRVQNILPQEPHPAVATTTDLPGVENGVSQTGMQLSELIRRIDNEASIINRVRNDLEN